MCENLPSSGAFETGLGEIRAGRRSLLVGGAGIAMPP